jgi:REP element-mobilizing transposase RayT
MGTRHHLTLNNQPYFVTATTVQRRPLFRHHGAARLFLQELEHCRMEMGFLLLSFVVMPDHVHLVLVPGPGADLSRIMQRVKGRFARALNLARGKAGAVWQPRFYDSAVRTEAQLNRWVRYVEEDPVRARLAASPGAYQFSSAGGALPVDLEHYLEGGVVVPG